MMQALILKGGRGHKGGLSEPHGRRAFRWRLRSVDKQTTTK
jgi:hypothetical protein